MKGYEHLLIRKPKSQPRALRVTWRTVTVLFWALYLYLLLPLLTLLLWGLGVRNSFVNLYGRQQGIDPFLLYALPLMAIAASMVVILWAEYNRRRFSGRDRRLRPHNTSQARIAAALHAPPELAERLAASRVVILHMDENAHPIGLTEKVLPIAAEPSASRVADLPLAAHHETLHGQRL